MRIWDTNYRRLEAGETVLAGDEFKTAGGWATTECPGVITEDPDMSQSLIYRRLKSIPVLLSGEWVVYEGRSYRFTGFVTAVCNDGQIVVQAHGAPDGTYRGMKHIYAPGQLRLAAEMERRCEHCDKLGAKDTVDFGDGPRALCGDCSSDLEVANITGEEIKAPKLSPTTKGTLHPVTSLAWSALPRLHPGGHHTRYIQWSQHHAVRGLRQGCQVPLGYDQEDADCRERHG